MMVDLRQLEKSSGRLSLDEQILLEDVFDKEASVKCHVELGYQRSGSGFIFHGDVSGVFHTSCHRCLTKVPYNVSGEFDVVVRRGTDRIPEGDSDSAEDYVILSLNEHQVSLDEYVYESVIVNIPMRIVCTDDCRGLCPSCGIDRNQKSCACEDVPDSRWDALRKLKDKPTE
jgi:uncharacterized protein